MLRRALARHVAVQDVVILHLRPRGRLVPLPSRQHKRSAASIRWASTNTDPAHDSLLSFLAYAKRSGLDRASTTFAGTYYEYAAQALLRRYGLGLTRVGGRGDRGVDLKGTWTVTTETDEQKIEMEVPVIVQCKRLKAKVGPNLIRELEGSLAGRSSTLGVLVGTNGATKGVRDAMGRSKVGICWIMLEVDEGASGAGREEEEEEEEGEVVEEKGKEMGQGLNGILQAMKDEIVSKAPGKVQKLLEPSTNGSPTQDESGAEGVPAQLGRVRQMLWNRAASNMGLEGLDVVMKYDGTRDDDGEVGKEVMLMWQGEKVRELTGDEPA